MPDASIQYYPNFIPYGESKLLADSLFKELVWQQDKIKMFGKFVDIPRLQAWYGDSNLSYTYSKLTLNAQPWTPLLTELKNSVVEKAGVAFNAVLANCYRDHNDSVSWHSDDEPELGIEPTIASLSFGAKRNFQLKHKHTGETFKLPLESGSLLIMSGATQQNWLHAVAKTRIEQPMRINLTFRTILTDE